MLLTLFLSTLIWGQTLPWKDTDFACLDQESARRYVRDFNIDVKSFGGLELCNSNVDTKKLLNDLEILEKGAFQKGQDNVFIRGFVDADNYYGWMKSQTRGMDRGSDMPTATAYNSGGYFTMQDGWSLLSTLGRVGTIVHEARHTGGYFHTQCNQGPYQDVRTSGCDSRYNYGGSHAVEMEYYARVSTQGKNFHPVYKTMARLMAIARSNFVFNEPVIKKREALLGWVDKENRADLFLDGNIYSREAPVHDGILKRTSFGAAVFDGRKAFSIELYGHDPLNTPILDTYSYFKILLENQKPVLDYEEFDWGVKRFVFQLPTPETLQFFDFSKGGWGRTTSTNIKAAGIVTRLENQQTGLFLVDQDFSIYPVNLQSKTVESKLNLKWNPEYISIVASGSNLYILKTDGLIYEKSNGVLKAMNTDGIRYRGLVNVPIYNGFEVSP